MNLDHDIFQVSKLSEEQKMEHIQVKTKKKKRSSPKMERFFPRIQVKTKNKEKERSSPQMERFFPQIQVQTCAQMHTRVKLLGGIQSNYWGRYIPPPPPPGFRHP